MKKLFSVLSCIILISLPLFATGWGIESVKLTLGNDKYAYGLSRNDDDQLSYSEHITLEGGNWFVALDLDGITNRGWRSNWNIYDPSVKDSLANFYNGRIDYALLRAGLKWDAFKAGPFSIHIEPGIGVAAAGYMHLDFLQNLIHKIYHIHSVDLPYDWGNTLDFYFYQSLYYSNSLDLLDFEKSQLDLIAEAYAEVSYGFSSSQQLAIGLSLSRGTFTYLSFSLGYIFSQSWSSSSTMELYNRYINGPYLTAMINTGIFSLDYTAYLKNHFGYGKISIDFMKIFEQPSWVRSDVMVSIGISRMGKINFSESELAFERDNGISIVLKNRYVAGYPIDRTYEYESDQRVVARTKRAFTSVTIGLKAEYPLAFTHDWISPYAMLSVGMAYWRYDILFNMFQGPETESVKDEGVPSVSLDPTYHFIIDLEVGIELFPQGLIKMGNTTLQLMLFGGAFWTVNSGSDFADYGYLDNSMILWGCIVPRFGAMASFGFDI